MKNKSISNLLGQPKVSLKNKIRSKARGFLRRGHDAIPSADDVLNSIKSSTTKVTDTVKATADKVYKTSTKDIVDSTIEATEEVVIPEVIETGVKYVKDHIPDIQRINSLFNKLAVPTKKQILQQEVKLLGILGLFSFLIVTILSMLFGPETGAVALIAATAILLPCTAIRVVYRLIRR